MMNFIKKSLKRRKTSEFKDELHSNAKKLGVKFDACKIQKTVFDNLRNVM